MAGYKTYIVAAATGAYAIGGYFLGQLDGNAAFQLISTALMGAFIRHGVTTESQK